MTVGDFRQFFDIDDVARGVADRLAEHSAGLVIDAAFKTLVIIEGGHAHFYALSWQGMRKQVIGAPVELTGADDIVASTRIA